MIFSPYQRFALVFKMAKGDILVQTYHLTIEVKNTLKISKAFGLDHLFYWTYLWG